jgi:bifunctional N-acetylglucosamine-1-phosphate-uridyltransferase/glucosamine-1-phosphate-acetyltransferase GlmU-like protein
MGLKTEMRIFPSTTWVVDLDPSNIFIDNNIFIGGNIFIDNNIFIGGNIFIDSNIFVDEYITPWSNYY